MDQEILLFTAPGSRSEVGKIDTIEPWVDHDRNPAITEPSRTPKGEKRAP
jgi:hypothetical protein